ncbi:BAG domain-containing protein Samui-like isoform X1 [Schistocerca piceifrons]|uniref:BAG domain-containing protein Samui-like isoform X1 n=1 Tax=Schistocerca piceifrons TaxID=274613 RepID=UPI001F5EDFBD|nr:BAG domain-containing protein Samui-like isoform X1 [Schistocerca piceifrons]XP_049950693.1 BAG domain-containing protein Samui isoform X1 [Schistocerca serialis cubense]
MSFSFRDKPRLSERLRGKSGDDLINELKNHIDQERKMFFDTAPNWGSVHPSGSFSSRTGFPFDDDMMPRSGRQDIRAHLDDLAQRHPEFADQLRCPPWAGEMSGSPSHTGTWGQNRRGSSEAEPHTQARSSSSGSNVESEMGTSSPKPEDNRGRNPFPQQGEAGRDDGGNRGHRSMSAPPDARNQQPPQPQNQPQQTPQPQRYVSRVNITPGKPPVAPQKPQSPQQSSSNVRHIPIFVEGRDEPILPKNLASEEPPPEQVFSQRIPPQPQQTFSKPQTYTSHHQFQPQQRFYSPPQSARTEYTRPQQNVPHSKPETIFSQQNSAPSMQQPAAQQPKEMPKPSQQPKPQQAKPPQPNDPIHRVQAVQKDVENLQRMVENFAGTSRKDKQYIYLDEMLTRNLLKLDDIDTEGKENVRQARKEAIRSIQKCISILESKVPAPEEQNENAVSEDTEGMQSVDNSDTTELREENPAEEMEADIVAPEPPVLENAGEKMEPDVKETEEHIEKMDVEHSAPTQQSETESSLIETKGESQPSAEVTETNRNENGEHKGESADTQLTMDMVVTPEAPLTESTNQVASEKPSEKIDKSDMEVEPPASNQTDLVQMEAEALPQKDVAVKTDVEVQKEGDVKEPRLPQTTKETEVQENVSATPENSKEAEPKTVDETSVMQIEPIPAGSEITNPPKAEELGETQQESAKENASSELTSDKDPKPEVDTKKKKTGKKVKSPSKKHPKQGSSSKADTISSSEEAQKS